MTLASLAASDLLRLSALAEAAGVLVLYVVWVARILRHFRFCAVRGAVCLRLAACVSIVAQTAEVLGRWGEPIQWPMPFLQATLLLLFLAYAWHAKPIQLRPGGDR